MRKSKVRAPASLLLHPDLTAAAKLIWLITQLDPDGGPTKLGAQSGLSQPTIRKSFVQLAETNLSSPDTRTVAFPVDLVTDIRLSAQARLMYGLLQLVPGFQAQRGLVTHAQLSDLSGLDEKTVRSSIRALSGAGWLCIDQVNQRAPLIFTLSHPEHQRIQAERELAERRIARAEFRGEALMKEYLSLLIDSDQFEDNATPGFLVNPYTKERLELDRFYPPGVAFEYQGAQHFGPSERYPDAQEAARQQGRDLIKQGICLERSIKLVIIQPSDLSLHGMKTKVGPLLPLRDLQHHRPLVDFLERLSRGYRRRAAAFK
jgi:hypothetical protein